MYKFEVFHNINPKLISSHTYLNRILLTSVLIYQINLTKCETYIVFGNIDYAYLEGNLRIKQFIFFYLVACGVLPPAELF